MCFPSDSGLSAVKRDLSVLMCINHFVYMKVQWVSCGSAWSCITPTHVPTSPDGKFGFLLIGTVTSSMSFIRRLFEDFGSLTALTLC